MIGKKGFLLLLLSFLLLGSYAWFGIVSPENEKQSQQPKLLPVGFLEDLVSFNLTSENSEIRIEKREDFWWVTSPNEYLADQEFVEKGLQIMAETQPSQSFKLKKDRFGLNPGKAFFNFNLETGQQKRLRVGTQSGPSDSIYVMDMDSSVVFAIHNVWGQFLYYPSRRFYHPYLPIPGNRVKSIELVKNGKLEWSVQSASAAELEIIFQGEKKKIGKANSLWLFQKLREFPLKEIQFGPEGKIVGAYLLNMQTNKGNIIFEFDSQAEKIWIKSLNVFAQIDPYSLKSLGYEIEKVMKSDKK